MPNPQNFSQAQMNSEVSCFERRVEKSKRQAQEWLGQNNNKALKEIMAL